MLGSLKIYEILKAHLPEPQARTVTHAIQQADADIRHDFKAEMAQILGPYATKADIAEVRTEIAEAKAEMIRWMFIFWVGQVASTIAIFKLLK
jgi:hypothetical protein